VAEILKTNFPKLVEMHNYPAANSYKSKMENWLTLDRKVFPKLGLHFPKQTFEKVVMADGISIHVILYALMMKTKEHKDCESRRKMSQETSDNLGSPVMTVNITKKIGASYEIVPQKMIVYEEYEKLERKVIEREQAFVTLRQKNQHLESLLSLKDLRICDLQKRLAQYTAPVAKRLLEFQDDDSVE
jgi:hypothetical protein